MHSRHLYISFVKVGNFQRTSNQIIYSTDLGKPFYFIVGVLKYHISVLTGGLQQTASIIIVPRLTLVF